MILSHLCTKKSIWKNILQSLLIRRKNSEKNGNFFYLYKIVLCLFFSFKVLYFDLFVFATYLFNILLNSGKLTPYIVTNKILISDSNN